MLPARNIQGHTLIEIAIVTVILTVVMVGITEAALSSTRQAALGSTEDTLSDDGHRVLRIIADDLAASAWQFADERTTYDLSAGWRRTAAVSGQDSNLPKDVDFSTDRGLRYYPFVVQQTSDGSMNSQGVPQSVSANQNPMSWFNRAAGMLPDPRGWPGNVPGKITDHKTIFGSDRTGYLSSFRARSQELVFLKSTAAGWFPPAVQVDKRLTLTPTIPSTGIRGSVQDWRTTVNSFVSTGNDTLANRSRIGVNYPSPWQRNAQDFSLIDPTGQGELYGVELRAARLNIDTAVGGDIFLTVNWETMCDPAPAVTVPITPKFQTPLSQGPANHLREYTYAVVPSPTAVGQLGRLVRAYRDCSALPAPSGSNVGEAISSGRASITTGSGTSVNQNVQIIVDRVLSDSVVRVVFDTRRHDATLAINQIRVRIYLSRRVEGTDMAVSRIVESVVTLGARVSNADMQNDIAALGTAPFIY